MKKLINPSAVLNYMFWMFLLSCTIAVAQETRLLSQPAISDSHIAFIYAEDLWVANKDGSNPKRLTIDEGIESNPIFSPDGTKIAFNAQYDGNTDVFIVPVSGGIPKRLTWHPYNDIVRDFSADGSKVMFLSQRNTYTNRHAQLFTISINGGAVTQLKIPNAFWASSSDDDSHMAYTPISDAFDQWKHYRGGRISRIWIYNNTSHKVEEISKPTGGCNDSNPQWSGDYVYFKSDRNGEFNLYSYNVNNKEISQLTNFKDFPVISLSANKNEIIFEQAGYLHIYNIAANSTKKLSINIKTDLLELRPRYVSDDDYIRSASISPSGARVVLDYRGDIITVPAKKGDPKNITNTTGVHEKGPEWSPDGTSIAYFSDESGEYAMHVQDLSTDNTKKIKLNGAGFYANIHWSPDSKKLSFVDNGRSLYVLNITTSKITKIASDQLYTPGVFRELFGDWSSDSNWISYTTITDTNFEQAHLYSISESKSYSISDGLSNISSPVFDPSGKYLYMLASTDAGPVVNWFDQSNQDMEFSNSIYLVTLQKETLSPFSKENDNEELTKESKDEPKKGETKKEEKVEILKIDWDGIHNRIVDIPVPSGIYRNLSAPKEGELYYLSRTPHENQSMLHKYSLKDRKDETIMQAGFYRIAAKGDKTLYFAKGKMGIADTGKKPDDGLVNTSAIQVKIDPIAEWKNIFNEAWRVNRDYFYDPGMHGVDWDAMKTKYEVFLPHVTCRSDLYRMMSWMFSELAVGHHRFSSRGDRMNNPQRISGGLLGADYEVSNNRYKISKIYGGLNWNPNLRSPLTEPGVNVNVGDYIIAVNGKNVSANDNLYSFFENTADKIITLTVSSNANGNDARTVKVTPVGNEQALRNRDWVEGNIKKVEEATNGQVAYVYVPNTAGAGHEYFKRYFFPQATKKAIIIDERYNGGGQLADYYIDMLKKPEQAYWNFRYGKDLKSPSASIQGPKVMIVDETAGSGGDYLPWMFRKFKIGTIVGKRTWGGLVGVLGYPEFIDGGIVTAPNVAFYTEDGFRVENEGVAPDIDIEQLPEQVIKGQDPQLEKAIEIALKELKENPPKVMKRPTYPIKTKN
ncbi:PDZ domain-containing protein [Sabulilitoribacter multivorans]|uniref:Tricorn protease homolog n=1 Tax=Flaviramulus multivorans TaxID=1304750 RepID=A0ABS9IMG3_9FLAO|nr:S41 family peptidase [Flaviramulus multivorans]MCF7561794.1 PDZ domain-containing protein [Flaviramulus multivorans]